MNYFLLVATIVFILLTIVHLYFCFFEKEKARKISKCFLMPSLIIVLISIECYNILIYPALLLSGVGDALLTKKDNKQMFVLGALAFLLAHVCYLTVMFDYAIDYSDYKLVLAILIATIFLGILFWKVLSTHFKDYALACFVYAFSLLLELICGIVILFNIQTFDSYLLLGGVLLFIISDSILAYTIFVKDIKRRDFYIMSTYIAAQVGISIGLFLI